MNGRNRRSGTHPNHERWLVSYADFITLLFALFVVLFAASNADKEKVHKFARAVENAIEHSGMGTNGGLPLQPVAGEPALNAAYTKLLRTLSSEIQDQQVRVALDARGLVITLNQTAFFSSGSADFDPSMYPTLGEIAGAITTIDNPIRLEGHTDSRPIHNDRFQDNWELSSARSIAVLQLLVKRFGIVAGRLAVAGYADTAPVSSNDNEAGRARNRRVDIVVLSGDATRKEPGGRP